MTPTDSNFEFLVEYITAKVVEWIMYDKDMGLEAALLSFHNSETFDLLCRRSTGMYVESLNAARVAEASRAPRRPLPVLLLIDETT